MQIFKNFNQIKNIKSSVVTIGTFDGMHRGHQKVIKQVIQRARQLQCTPFVLTYAEHPKKILFSRSHQKVPLLITSLEQKLEKIKKCGIEHVVLIPFTKSYAAISPEDFILKKVLPSLKVKEFCVGPDSRFGQGGKGNIAFLKKMGKVHGFGVRVNPPVKVKGKLISSSMIRKGVMRSSLKEVSRSLGAPYSIVGKVIKGHGIGRELGFPTANIDTHNQLLPSKGVYAVKVKWDHAFYDGILNLGHCPTFSKKTLNIEIHLFNFKQNLYDEKLEIFFVQKIRNEKKFKKSIDLIQQIGKDMKQVKRWLKKVKIKRKIG